MSYGGRFRAQSGWSKRLNYLIALINTYMGAKCPLLTGFNLAEKGYQGPMPGRWSQINSN